MNDIFDSTENVSSADNQQERLIKIGWIIGFVDGEGCFSVGIVNQPNRKEPNRIRKGYKTGYQVFHEFAVTQGAKSIASLESLQSYFQVGKVLVNTRHDNHKEDLYRYVVRKRSDLLNVIIPFFQKYQLQTSKKIDFEKFVSCLDIIEKGIHLNREGLISILQIAETMNRRKSRANLIKILRDYTSDTELIQ